jgi:hypothetical protein
MSVQVTSDTRNIFVEVTSSQGLDVCKKVMEELLNSLLLMGIGQADPLPPVQKTASADESASDLAGEAVAESDMDLNDAVEDLEIQDPSAATAQTLVVQQVKVLDALGTLKVIYPSRIDLQSDLYHVVRDYE